MINLDRHPEAQKKALFYSTLRGLAAHWVRLLDTPVYRQLRTLFDDGFWVSELQHQEIADSRASI